MRRQVGVCSHSPKTFVSTTRQGSDTSTTAAGRPSSQYASTCQGLGRGLKTLRLRRETETGFLLGQSSRLDLPIVLFHSDAGSVVDPTAERAGTAQVSASGNGILSALGIAAGPTRFIYGESI